MVWASETRGKDANAVTIKVTASQEDLKKKYLYRNQGLVSTVVTI
jgi:hypothetical protein